MWGRRVRRRPRPAKADEPQRLKEALRRARIDAAERTGVVVDLHDAEVARLELLNEALDPLFAEIPARGRPVRPRHHRAARRPRLWIDAIAHVAMGRDKRIYRFVQDTRYGRKVLAESVSIPEMVEAVTKYVAQRHDRARARAGRNRRAGDRRRPPRGAVRSAGAAGGARCRTFMLGAVRGFAVLVALAILFAGPRA